ncbi:MAG TPA: DUF58 domain-containing protein [Parachlamydiaceae bacterium]|nr:DUF58 domain-containing protein [Parachlamydiaceae bacterium]
MLYPDFNDLVAFKDLKLDLVQPSFRASQSTVLGAQHSPFRGQGLEFDSVRKYVPGDDIRNIDWRVTARTNTPHLKIFKEERERHIVLCVDMNAAMRFGTRNTFKSVQAARVAALLGWRGMANQDRISGCLYGDVPDGVEYFAPQRTRKSFSTLLKRLSEPTHQQHSIPIADVFKHVGQAAHTGSLIYFISDFMEIDNDFQHEMHISRLVKKSDVVFISINDAADRSISSVGNLGFCGLDKETVYVNTDSNSGRSAYEQQWKENREMLYGITSKWKIPLVELTTESDIRRELVLGLKSIARRKRR